MLTLQVLRKVDRFVLLEQAKLSVRSYFGASDQYQQPKGPVGCLAELEEAIMSSQR